jgi:hypothetical protein
MVDAEQSKEARKREKHLMQMDNTKRMYID